MNRQIHDEAADFFVELQGPNPNAAQRQAFDTWLRASPEHIRAYLQILPGWDDAARLTGTTIEQLVRTARQDANVTTFPAPHTLTDRQETRGAPGARKESRMRRYALAAGVAFIALCALGLYRISRDLAAPTYTTKTGELLTLQLSDGSSISLNTQSRIRLQFNDRFRYIELSQGQALFRVARDPSRPFIVKTDDTQVRALGTAFDVRRNHTGTTVTVVEGKVAVSEESSWLSGISPIQAGAPSQSPAVVLTANQKTTSTGSGIAAPKPADSASVTAWTQRRLVFDATPLSEVIDEFNRYSTQRISLDPALAPLSITASFGSTDPTSLVNFLETLPDIQVQKDSETTRVTARPH